MRRRQTPQASASFTPGDPSSGYYSDLRESALRYGSTPEAAGAGLQSLVADRARANPVTVAQLGIGAWQLSAVGSPWRDVVARAVEWLVEAMDEQGRLAYLFPMPHTYALTPPWYSAMAQGEAASLLVRAAETLDDASLAHAAARVATPLLEPTYGLVAETDEGPVLQEYPTSPPAHVLNGWISALWGLYDVGWCGALAPGAREPYRRAFLSGTSALAARLPLYRIGRGWSRYDLYPHPLPNVASPFYHRLHVEQLLALQRLAPHDEIARTAEEWRSGLDRPLTRARAVAGKVAFRIVKPRSRKVPWRFGTAT